ncbi:MAG: hypothetical protein ACP5NB_13525 [Chloroflexia bacterium]
MRAEEMHVVMNLATYEDLWKRGEELLWFVEQGYERILQKLPRRADKVILYGSPVGKISNRQFIFNEKNWARFRKELREGKLGYFALSLWLECRDNPERVAPYGAGIHIYTYPDYPGHASILMLGAERPFYGEQPLDAWQEEWVDLACEAFVRFHGATGFIIVDASSWREPSSPYEGEARVIGAEYHFRSKVRGYYWGNFLSREHIERLGGLEAVLREAPCYLVRDLSDGEDWRAYLQLTAKMEDVPEEALRALRDYLRPLLPGPERLPPWDPHYGRYRHVLYGE